LLNSTASSLHGIGGAALVVGRTPLRIKIGKFQTDHAFQVLAKPIAGYDVLIGQDFMRAVGCAIRMYQQSCTLEIGPDSTALYARITRSLKDSITEFATEFDRQYDDILPHVLLPNCLPSLPEEDELELVSSTNFYRNLMRDV
jgi:hypothetical protein